MKATEVHVVTGAFGYSGRYITRRLVDAGVRVRTLTNAPQRANPFGADVEVHPYSFDAPARLVEALRGASVLYNTYWIRFNHRRFKQADAVENTLTLFAAAREAGVRRVVHVSITNPSENSPLVYFSGKAKLERALTESGLSYAILRPTVLFGKEHILINNIAWILRRFPVFGVFGDGKYRLQPMFVDDMAELAVREGAGTQDCTIDAIGPETFTYRELVRAIGEIIGRPRPIVSLPPTVGHLIGAVMGKLVGDVVITRAEIAGLMADLLCTDSPPSGATRLSEWARAHADTLGVRYASEMARRTDRTTAYENLRT
jgi:NADH dehydrogenase